MAKTLLYRLLRIGRVPARLRRELEAEGVLIWEEGIPVKITWQKGNSPGELLPWNRIWISGALVLTHQRFAGFGLGKLLIETRLEPTALSQIEWSLGGREELWVTFEASRMDDRQTGRVEIAFQTSLATNIFARLERLISNGPGAAQNSRLLQETAKPF